MRHSCNICGRQMRSVGDIEIKGIQELTGRKVRGWRCACGNEHSNPADVDVLVEYYKVRRAGFRVSLFRSGNSWAIRLPAALIRALRLDKDSGFRLELDGNSIVLTPSADK